MKRFLLLLALAFPALAARTTVADTLTRADGTTCSGTISISWPSFTNGDGFFFAGTTTSTINPATGAFLVSLEPGPYYTVTYVVAPSGCTPTTEFWSVPTSGTPVPLSSVRSVAPPPPLPNTIPLTYITQSGATTGQCAAWNGNNWAPAACGTGGGGDVVGPSSATDNAITRFNSTTGKLIQNSLATLDDSGNLSTPGTASFGIGSGEAGGLELTQGSAPLLGTTSVIVYAPTSVTSYAIKLPAAAGDGCVSGENSANFVTLSFVSCGAGGDVVWPGSATDNAITRFDTTTGKLIQNSLATIDDSGNISTPGTISAGVGSGNAGAIELPQGSPPSLGTTSVIIYSPVSVTSYAFLLPSAAGTGILHATNAANIDTLSISSVVSADLNITTTTCSAQFIRSLSSGAVGTCASVAIATDVSGLGTGVATALGTAVSGTGAICLASGSACSGGATNIDVGTSTISSGTTTRILYDNAGIVGEYTLTGTGTVAVMQGSPTLTTPVIGAATGTSLAVTGGLTSGTDNSAAGTLQLANSAANAHTVFGSGATTTNTINGFATVPTTGHLIDCTVSSTTCLLHDHGLIVAADITSATITGTQIASSIALAGSPTTTTQSPGDNSTKIATTAYVNAAAGGGGSFVLVEQHSASSSAALSFTSCISSTYDDYQIEFINIIPGTTAQNFLMRVSTDGGMSYDSGSNYKFLGSYNGFGDVFTAISSAGTTSITISQSNSTQTSWSLNGTMTMQGPGSAIFKATHSHVSSPVGAGNLYYWNNDGIYASTTAVNAFQFFFASGNIASGTIRCYGIAK